MSQENYIDPALDQLRSFRDQMDQFVQSKDAELSPGAREEWAQARDQLTKADQRLDDGDKDATLREIGIARQAVSAARAHVENMIARMGDHAPAALKNALQGLSDSGLSTMNDALAAITAAEKANNEANAAEGEEFVQHMGEALMDGISSTAMAFGGFADKKLQSAMNQFKELGGNAMDGMKSLVPGNLLVQSSGGGALGELGKVTVGKEETQHIGKA